MSFKTLSGNAQSHQLNKATLVSRPIPGREKEMARNNGGGFTFVVDDWTMLDRFLIIGTTGGSYYATENAQNKQAIPVVKKLAETEGKRVAERCIEISAAGRAKNNDFALFAYAHVMAFGNVEAKKFAGDNLHLVARTGTHLMHFTAFANGLRGWGKTLKRAVQKWYGDKNVGQIAYQALKYQSRDGWSHRDIFRLAHVHPGTDAVRNNLYRYIAKKGEGYDPTLDLPQIVHSFEDAKTADASHLIELIKTSNLPHEMIPNDSKGNPDVWAAMLPGMGLTALIRNLNKMTAIGLIAEGSEASKVAIAKLTDGERLRAERVHPLTLYIAFKQYGIGSGLRGSLTWRPVKSILKALEDAFYLSFAVIEPTGKNRMIALDVSGSMSSYHVMGIDGVTCREASAIMAMATLRAEPWSAIYGFSSTFVDLKLNKTDSLDQVTRKISGLPFAGTNMSLPMELALKQGWKVDSFEVYTDNEINQGRWSPSQALKNYRAKSGVHDAKLVAVGMAVNRFTIADPQDRGMMDVAGFDSQAPQFISQFVAGLL